VPPPKVQDGKAPTSNDMQAFVRDASIPPVIPMPYPTTARMTDTGDQRPIRPMRKRDRLRKIKDAEDAIIVCEGAISRAPDDVARSIFERSQRIWRKRLEVLKLSREARSPQYLGLILGSTTCQLTG
jgi:hypothetical protein